MPAFPKTAADSFIKLTSISNKPSHQRCVYYQHVKMIHSISAPQEDFISIGAGATVMLVDCVMIVVTETADEIIELLRGVSYDPE